MSRGELGLASSLMKDHDNQGSTLTAYKQTQRDTQISTYTTQK